MIKLIGTENCSKCIITKQILDRKGIEYEYLLLDELSKEEQSAYLVTARRSGYATMPLIIKDDKFITLEEA
jgi:glutaredoxin